MTLTTLVKPSEVQKSPQNGQQHHCSSVWDPCTGTSPLLFAGCLPHHFGDIPAGNLCPGQAVAKPIAQKTSGTLFFFLPFSFSLT